MKPLASIFLAAVICTAGFASSARAAVLLLPGLDVNYIGNNQSLNTGTVSLGTMSLTDGAPASRYCGGTIAFSNQGNAYGSSFLLQFFSGGTTASQCYLTAAADGSTNWKFGSAGAISPSSSSSTPIDFVIELVPGNFGVLSLKLYLGSNATSAIQPGAPDYTAGASFFNWSNAPIDGLKLSYSAEAWAPTNVFLTSSNMFAADTWTPVGVPEPKTYVLLLIGLGMLMGIRRMRSAGTNAKSLRE